jgi:RNase P subunit RPR2
MSEKKWMRMICKNCRHYSFYQMITSGRPYGYSGTIPCTNCKHFSFVQDNYEPYTEENALSPFKINQTNKE